MDVIRVHLVWWVRVVSRRGELAVADQGAGDAGTGEEPARPWTAMDKVMCRYHARYPRTWW